MHVTILSQGKEPQGKILTLILICIQCMHELEKVNLLHLFLEPLH
jgi:hypothetical protein